MITAEKISENQERMLADTVHDMLLAVAPERSEELQRLWNEFQPQFHILPDGGRDGPLVMDAGGFVLIRFNHRIMRLFWLGSFAFWEGYLAAYNHVRSGGWDTGRFVEVVECFEATREAEDVDSVRWPSWIPQPGVLVNHVAGDHARVVGEVAIFSVAWAFLHEIQHLIHQQRGTSAVHSDVGACRNEEMSCDSFATRFLIERIQELPTKDSKEAAIALGKRQLGIYSVAFVITLLARDNWGQSAEHPAVQDRIDQIVGVMDKQQLDKVAATIGVSAFNTLKQISPDAPDPEAAVGAIANRDGWTGDDDLIYVD